MKTKKIKKIQKMVRKAVGEDQRTGGLARAVNDLAKMRGVSLQPQQAEEICSFIREYVEHAPALIDQIGAAARDAQVADEIDPLLAAAGEYFFAPHDVIPDHLGLVGLVDDAYVTHMLIQGASEFIRNRTGKPLLQADYSQLNLFIRGVIGEPHASVLDSGVAVALQGPMLEQMLGSLPAGGLDFGAVAPDPIWGHASMDEIVDARLGAMGVV